MNSTTSTIRHLLPLALALAAGGWSHAAVTYVDPTDIVIPFSFEGVYLDLETETANGSSVSGEAAADSYTISYTEPASGDWDVNFFFGGALMVHNTTFQPYREDDANPLSAVNKIGLGTVIDGSPVDLDPGAAEDLSSPLSAGGLGGSGTTTGGDINGNQSPTHMGTAADQFASGTTGYIAFVLNPDTTPLYGWMQVTLADDGSTGTIHDWAYSDIAIEIGQVPEPGSAALLLPGAFGLLRRRR